MVAMRHNVPQSIGYRIELAMDVIKQVTEANKKALKQAEQVPLGISVIKWFRLAQFRFLIQKVGQQLEYFDLLFKAKDEFDYPEMLEILEEFNDFLFTNKQKLVWFYQLVHIWSGGHETDVGTTIFNVYTFGGRI